MVVRQILVSDISDEPDAVTTPFGYDDVAREIDLTRSELDEFEVLLRPYIAVARKISEPTQRKRRVPETTAEERAEIRAWARDEGLRITGWGQVPLTIFAAYQAAHDPQGR